jgi:hypothetical protein
MCRLHDGPDPRGIVGSGPGPAPLAMLQFLFQIGLEHDSRRPPGQKSHRPNAQLGYQGLGRMENRHGLVVDMQVTQVTGTAEREVALALDDATPRPPRATLGADKNDDTRDCVRVRRERHVTPHVVQQTTGGSSAMEELTTRHPGYAVSQWTRTGVEAILGWIKTAGLLGKTRPRGLRAGRVDVHL